MTGGAHARIDRVFVDTSGFFARSDRDDNHHTEALAIQQRLIVNNTAWFISSYVIAETHALFLRRLGLRQGLEFLERVQASNLTVVRVTAADDLNASNVMRQYDDKDFSFTDATAFVIMQRLGIRYSFTFDRHFAQYGVETLSA